MLDELQLQFRILLLVNPFNVEEQRELYVDYVPGASLQAYISELDSELTEDVTLHLIIKGKDIPEEDWDSYIPEASDTLIITGRIEGGMGVTLAIWAANAAATWASYSWVAYYVAYYATLAAYYAVMTYGMSMLMSALSDTPDMDSGEQQPTSYRWGSLRNTQGQGQPMQILFGKHLMSGHKLNSFVDYTGEDINESLHSLFGLGDGPFHSISDIRINGQPYDNFADVTVEIGLGSANGEIMSDFDRIVTHHPLSRTAELNSVMTETLLGTALDIIEIDLVAASGIYKVKKSTGHFHGKTVDMVVTYIPETGGTLETKRVTMAGSGRDPIHKKVVFTDVQAGTDYTITVEKVSGTDGSESRRVDTITWAAYRGIIKQELVYPGIAKYGVHALATNQLSGGEPSFTCMAERWYIDEDDAYWNTKHLTNPAWASLALLVHYRGVPADRIELGKFTEWANWCQPDGPGGSNERIAINHIIDVEGGFWDQLQKVAQLGRGVIVRRGWKYSVVIDKAEDVRTHIFNTANIVKGSFSINYLPKVDRANVVEATFRDEDRRYESSTVSVYSEDFLSNTQESRKVTVDVSGITKREYVIDKASFLLNSNKYLLRAVTFQAKIDSFSCVVSDRVGIRHDIIDHETGLDGRVVSAGPDSVVLDVPVQVDGDKTYAIIVRHSSHNPDYSDQFETELLVNPESAGNSGMHAAFGLAFAWTITPAAGDLYSFGEYTSLIRDYRITNITRADDLTREIQCIEYIPEIYTDGAPVYTTPIWDPHTQEAINVTAVEQVLFTPAGTYQSLLSVSWTPSLFNSGFAWAIWLVDVTDPNVYVAWLEARDWSDDDPWHEVDTYPIGVPRKIGVTSDIFFDIPYSYLGLGRSYKVIVSPADGGPVAHHAWVDTTEYIAGNVVEHEGLNYSSLEHNNVGHTPVVPSNWWALVGGNQSETVMIEGKLMRPADVLSLSAIWKPFTRSVAFTWPKVLDVDLDHYEIRRGVSDPTGPPADAEASWEAATAVPELSHLTGEIKFYYIEEPTDAVVRFWIKAFDTSGLESVSPTYFDITIDTTAAEIEIPTGLDYNTDEDDLGVYVVASWNDNSAASDMFSRYEVKLINNETGWVDVAPVVDPHHTWYIVGNTSYSLQVQAVDKNNQPTGWSGLVSFISAISTKPPADVAWPGEAWEITPGFKTIGFSWVYGTESDLIGYHIQRAENSAFSEGLVDLGIKLGNQFIDTGLEVDVEYFYRVKGANNSGVESITWSPVRSATTLQVGNEDIAYNAIYAHHLRADQAYVATIASSNWVPGTSGFKLDSTTGEAIFYNISMKLEATNVTGLGGLALEDTVPYDDIVGSKPPANADVTADNISRDTLAVNQVRSTTLIKGGFIGTGLVKADSIVGTELSAVKTSTGTLDISGVLTVGPDGSIRCGNPWQTPGGYRFDMYDGEPRFKVGNKDRYMYFRPSSGLKIKGPVVIAGNIEANNIGMSAGNLTVNGNTVSVAVTCPDGVEQNVAVMVTAQAQFQSGDWSGVQDPYFLVTLSGACSGHVQTKTGKNGMYNLAIGDSVHIPSGGFYTFTAAISGDEMLNTSDRRVQISVVFIAVTGS